MVHYGKLKKKSTVFSYIVKGKFGIFLEALYSCNAIFTCVYYDKKACIFRGRVFSLSKNFFISGVMQYNFQIKIKIL